MSSYSFIILSVSYVTVHTLRTTTTIKNDEGLQTSAIITTTNGRRGQHKNRQENWPHIEHRSQGCQKGREFSHVHFHHTNTKCRKMDRFQALLSLLTPCAAVAAFRRPNDDDEEDWVEDWRRMTMTWGQKSICYLPTSGLTTVVQVWSWSRWYKSPVQNSENPLEIWKINNILLILSLLATAMNSCVYSSLGCLVA